MSPEVRRGKFWPLLGAAISIGFILPVFYLIFGVSLFPALRGHLSFLEFVTSSSASKILVNTLEFSIPHAVIAVSLAALYAWIVSRTDIRAKAVFQLLPILGITMPILVKSIAWVDVFDPRVGLANLFIHWITGSNSLTLDIYSMAGMIFAASFGAIPISYIIIMPAMRSLTPSLEEASRVGGAGLRRTLTGITFPLLLPAILSALLLVIIDGTQNFEIPYIIGGPAHIQTLSTEIYFFANELMPPQYGSAGIVSILFVIITLALFAVYLWYTRRLNKFVVIGGASGRQVQHKLGIWKFPALAFCVIVLIFSFALPFGTLLIFSLTNMSVTTINQLHFTFLEYFKLAVDLPFFFGSLETTLMVALFSAVGATFLAILFSYGALKSKAKGARLLEVATSAPLAFPGIVYGVALLWTFLLAPGLNTLYGTVVPLLVALLFVRLPYTTRIISSNVVQISEEMEEASRIGGSGPVRTFGRILLPLLRSGAVYSFIYAFVNSMRELGAVILLVTPQTLVFTALIFDYYGTAINGLAVVSAASVILTLIITIVLLFLSLLSRLFSHDKSVFF